MFVSHGWLLIDADRLTLMMLFTLANCSHHHACCAQNMPALLHRRLIMVSCERACAGQVYKNGVEIKHLKNIPTVDKAKSTTVRRVSCRHLEDFSDMWVQRWEASGLPRKKHVLKLFLSTSAPQQPQQPPHTEDAGADAGADAARDAAAPAEVPAAVPPEAMAAQPMATPAASCAGHEPAQRHTVAAEPPAQAMPAPQEELTAAPAPVKASGALASAAPVHPAGPSAAASLAAPAGSAAVAAAWGSAGPDGQAAVQSRDVPVDASSAAATQTVGATTEGASRAPVPDQGPQPAALAQLEAEGYAEAQPPQLLRPEPEAEAHLPPQPQPQVVPVATQEPPGPVAHDGGNVEREAAAPGHRVVAAEALEHVEPAVGPTMPADAAAKADAHCAHAGVNMPRSVPVQAAAPEQEQLPAGPPASGGAAGEQAPDGLLAAAGAGGNAGVQPPGPTWPMEVSMWVLQLSCWRVLHHGSHTISALRHICLPHNACCACKIAGCAGGGRPHQAQPQVPAAASQHH